MTGFNQRMAELGAQFCARAADDRQLITAALVTGDVSTVRSTSHRLAGIAGIFGHSEIGSAAEEVEAAIERKAPMAEIRCLGEKLVERLGGIAQDGLLRPTAAASPPPR